MQFNLEKDLVFFDIESTGLNVMRDRILQIALIKYIPNQKDPLELYMLINPEIPISEEATQIHGITNEQLQDKPKFYEVGKEIYDFIGDSDLAGYNSDRYDVPLLMEEFHRIGLTLDISNRRLIDVQKIFYKMEPRTLKAALKFYCNKELEDAHDALADTKATVEIFKGQIRQYQDTIFTDAEGKNMPSPIKNDIASIAEFLKQDGIVDVTQRLKKDSNGVISFNFGKYIGQPVHEVFRKEPSYFHWIIEKDFSAQVKQIVTKIFDELKRS